MLQEAHDALRPVLASGDGGFRWRGADISRIEGLSDAVFGFAITLLVVSLEVPKTFAELREMMHGFFGFGICFVLLLFIWYGQYIYFRRYALDDRTSFVLNAALLFVVAFYIYPLKFLFTTLVNQVTGYRPMENGVPLPSMNRSEWSELMLIYGAGFIGLYVIFTLLYLHAYRSRAQLALNAVEEHATRSMMQENLLMIGIGALSMLLAWQRQPALSGMSYMLISPVLTVHGFRNARRRKQLMATNTAPLSEAGA
jgi:uncharacterized membrane protein